MDYVKYVKMRLLMCHNTLLRLLFTVVACCFYITVSFSQPPLPPRALTITATQPIHFGTMCVTGGVGGTVTVAYNGSRSATGDVLLLEIAPVSQPAIFEVKLCEGRLITITFDASVVLSGSNGGTLIMDIGPTEKGTNGVSFATNSDCTFVTPLRVGGTLHVPGAVLPGLYTGSFAITFNQE